MGSRISRRGFVKGAAWGAAGGWILRDSRSVWSYQANEKLNLAVVGVGRRGSHHARTVLRLGQNLVALSDVDRRRAEPWKKQAPGAVWYEDFRRMLDEQDGRLDGVISGATPHNHTAIAVAAMRRGKHVYIEKPAGRTVAETRALRQVAAEKRVATQMGNQGMATDSFRRTLELVHDGVVGEIREAHVWFIAGGAGPRDLPTGELPVPDYLNWDLWLGPLPFRPYHPVWMSGAWREVGVGMPGGSHVIHMVFKGLRLGALWGADGEAPGTIRIQAKPSELSRNTFPRWQTIHYDVPARGSLPPARVHWYNAPENVLEEKGILRKLKRIAGRSLVWKGSWKPMSGSMLVGSRGVVHTNTHNSICAILPESDFPDAGGPPQRLPRSGSHEREWMAACRGQATPISSFNHSGPAMELLMLGNVATLFPDQTLEYDPKEGKIVNLQEANRWLSRPRRKGWEL